MADNLEIIKCPACGKEMRKVYIMSANLYLDICVNGCGGIYFDNRELEKFDEKHEHIEEIVVLLEGKTFQPVEEHVTRYCPCCYDMPLTKMGAAGGKIQIDVCNNCGGKFLDYGELEKIRNTEITQNEIMNELRQIMQIQSEDMESIYKVARFVEAYRKIVPWHEY